MLGYKNIILCAAVVLASLSAGAGEESRPNVLFISIDDLRPELGCYGADYIKSPNMDKLAEGGTLFTQAYCQQAVCNPSRASLMTGLRPDTIKVWDLPTSFRDTTPDVVTLPEYFKHNGYATQAMGKIYHLGHGNSDDAQSWSIPYQVPKKSQYLLEENLNRLAALKEAAKKSGSKEKIKGPATECADVPDNAYKDGATTDLAIKALNELKDKPFFLGVGYSKPHLPFCAPKKYWDLYDPSTIVVPSTERPENSPDIAFSNWGELRNYNGMPKEGYVADDQARNLIHGYYASVSFVDAQVGMLLAELDKLGLRENTIVILWGDHGWKLGDYGCWCKHTNLEIDTRVPLIISLPNNEGTGQTTDALVEFVDIYPTLAELCGLKAVERNEGTSMVPLLENPDLPWKKAAFSQYPRGSDKMGYSIRSGKWRYTEWINRKTGKLESRELYDHSKGPIATRNLADFPEYKDEVERLSKILDKGQGWRVIKETHSN